MAGVITAFCIKVERGQPPANNGQVTGDYKLADLHSSPN